MPRNQFPLTVIEETCQRLQLIGGDPFHRYLKNASYGRLNLQHLSFVCVLNSGYSYESLDCGKVNNVTFSSCETLNSSFAVEDLELLSDQSMPIGRISL